MGRVPGRCPSFDDYRRAAKDVHRVFFGLELIAHLQHGSSNTPELCAMLRTLLAYEAHMIPQARFGATSVRRCVK